MFHRPTQEFVIKAGLVAQLAEEIFIVFIGRKQFFGNGLGGGFVDTQNNSFSEDDSIFA